MVLLLVNIIEFDNDLVNLFHDLIKLSVKITLVTFKDLIPNLIVYLFLENGISFGLSNIIFLWIIIGVFICCFMIIYKPLYSGMDLFNYAMILIVIFKLIGYILCFNTILSYFPDEIKNKIDNKLTIFLFQDPYKVFGEIAIVAFIIDRLILRMIPEEIKEDIKTTKTLEIDLQLGYKEPEIFQKKSKKHNINLERPRIYNVNLTSEIKRAKNKLTIKEKVKIYGLIRFLIGMFLGYIFSRKSVLGFKFTNTFAVTIIYIYLMLFLISPFFLYICMVLYEEEFNIRHIFWSIKQFFINFFKSLFSRICRCCRKEEEINTN